jgi:hypothetical protein
MGRRGGGGGATEAVREPRRRSCCVEADESAAIWAPRGRRELEGGGGSDFTRRLQRESRGGGAKAVRASAIYDLVPDLRMINTCGPVRSCSSNLAYEPNVLIIWFLQRLKNFWFIFG